MKLPKFDLCKPHNGARGCGASGSQQRHGEAACRRPEPRAVLAFRLAAPSTLVDLGRIAGLDNIEIDDAGVHLGARVRWCDIEADARLATAHPLLAAAITHVAHYQIRKRGTVGGSLAHADPAAEMPGIAVACDAELTLVGSSGSRLVPAAAFFLGPLTTALAPDELITQIRLPPWPSARRWGFQEFARRRGDFALAGVAAFYDLDSTGHATNTHIGVIGVDDRPRRLTAAEAVLDGRAVDANAITATAQMAAQVVDPPDDVHGTARYRRALLTTLVERALTSASAKT